MVMTVHLSNYRVVMTLWLIEGILNLILVRFSKLGLIVLTTTGGSRPLMALAYTILYYIQVQYAHFSPTRPSLKWLGYTFLDTISLVVSLSTALIILGGALKTSSTYLPETPVYN